MFNKILLVTATALGFANIALAHNGLDLKEGMAGFRTEMTMSVNHGCKGSPVVGLRLKVPDGIVEAKAAFDPFWTIEYKMRKLDVPVVLHGRPVSEVPDEIIWKDPATPVPANGWYPFRFKMTLPDEPRRVMHIKNITVCQEGTDPYVDLPEKDLDVDDPDFAAKAWAFMIATPNPAPFLIVRAPVKKQYPWEWTPAQVRGEQGPSDSRQARAD